jgi:dTDP-4-dehydrorhamnose 3,5-epimerase-like enzyme
MPDEGLISLQTIKVAGHPELGGLSVVEAARDLPFDVKRVYYSYGVSSGQFRGGHAHKKLRQFLICAFGSIKITLDDGSAKREFLLDDPSRGLIVPPGCWRTMEWLEGGSVLLVLASESYDEGDYIRDYDHFINWVRNKNGRAARP